MQLDESNIVSGIVELPREKMESHFNDTVDKAVKSEQDPTNIIRYRVLGRRKEYVVCAGVSPQYRISRTAAK